MGDYAIVEFLLKNGADIDIKEPNYDKNAEKIAEELAHGKIVELLRKWHEFSFNNWIEKQKVEFGLSKSLQSQREEVIKIIKL